MNIKKFWINNDCLRVYKNGNEKEYTDELININNYKLENCEYIIITNLNERLSNIIQELINNFKSLQQNEIKINRIDINNTYISYIPTLPLCTKFYLNKNKLKHIDNQPLGKILQCDDNNLEKLPDGNWVNISCKNNNIDKIQYLNLCKYLNCCNNNIAVIKNLDVCETLICINNKLETLPNMYCLRKILPHHNDKLINNIITNKLENISTFGKNNNYNSISEFKNDYMNIENIYFFAFSKCASKLLEMFSSILFFLKYHNNHKHKLYYSVDKDCYSQLKKSIYFSNIINLKDFKKNQLITKEDNQFYNYQKNKKFIELVENFYKENYVEVETYNKFDNQNNLSFLNYDERHKYDFNNNLFWKNMNGWVSTIRDTFFINENIIAKELNSNKSKCIFFIRDPRNILTSSFTSFTKNHMSCFNEDDKIKAKKIYNKGIDQFCLSETHEFPAPDKNMIKNYFTKIIQLNDEPNTNVLVIKFEDLNKDNFVNDIINFLDIDLKKNINGVKIHGIVKNMIKYGFFKQIIGDSTINHVPLISKNNKNTCSHINKLDTDLFKKILKPETIYQLNIFFKDILEKYYP